MRIHLVATLFAVAVTGACTETTRTPTQPDSVNVPVRIQTDQHAGGHGAQPAGTPENFRTHLTGDEEVPAVDTKAQGQSTFQLNREGTAISFRLIVANIQNVTQAHIHLGPAGANGPVVVWLYPSGPPPVLIPGRSQGVLAEGTFTEENLVGPLAGASLDDLLDAMRAENTYVNVHTSQFPPGEIRGQID